MTAPQYILAIDQGTSGTKAVIFDHTGAIVAKATEPLRTIYHQNGFVEQDPEEIYLNVLSSVTACVQQFCNEGGDLALIEGCGISNQRETFVLWDKNGKPYHNAVVWQCKRSTDICDELKSGGHELTIRQKTGLLIDPYFSGTKLMWLYRHNKQIREAVDAGEAYFGTVDTWLLYKLTNGRSYLTDYTNASRTLFFNLATLGWDYELLEAFGLSRLNLAECRPSSHHFDNTDFDGLLPFPIAVHAMIGDSHAAAFGEGCYVPGAAKATLGTGCSIMMNTGSQLVHSSNGMVSTICWSTGEKVQYGLEGVIVTCGATIEWLKHELGLISNAAETSDIAVQLESNEGVYLVPAFSGLGAPHWQMNRKATITGMTFGTTKAHIVRAALESIPYQVRDVIDAMTADTGTALQQLMVDGGISSNHFVVQFMADLLGRPVVNIGISDVSALGAAYLAGLNAGIFQDLEHLSGLHRQRKVHDPSEGNKAEQFYRGWKTALNSGV